MSDSGFRLMIPGPVSVSPEVLAAMSKPIVPHYGPEFVSMYFETIALLKQVFETRQDAFIMVSSGTTAIESCVGSALYRGEKIIVGENGYFGKRLIKICRGKGLEVIPVYAEEGQPLTVADFQEAVQNHPDAKAVMIVHLETSTTIINPLAEIAAVAKNHGMLMIVDAVSSLGGIPVKVDEWGLDLVASSSQKCLGAPPGLAVVSVSDFAWRMIDRQPEKEQGWITDLRTWREFVTDWGDWHPTPVTMAVNNFAALHVALTQLIDEGIETRLARYRYLAERLRDGLTTIGFLPFTPPEHLNPVLTAAYGPEGIKTGEIVAFLADEYRIKVSGGLATLKDKIFRIGHMSPMVNKHDIDAVLDALERFPIPVS